MPGLPIPFPRLRRLQPSKWRYSHRAQACMRLLSGWLGAHRCEHEFSSFPEVSVSTILHVIFGYFFLLLVVRVLSRRPGGQLTLFEFVIVFLIGGVIILSTVGSDRSITNCSTAILTVGLLHWGVSAIKIKFPRFGEIVDGTPLTLLKKGEWQVEIMKGMKIDREDVMAAARTKGVNSVFDIAYAILERNGSISIIKAQR